MMMITMEMMWDGCMEKWVGAAFWTDNRVLEMGTRRELRWAGAVIYT